MIINKLVKLVFGSEGGLTTREREDMVYRKKFSDNLPWEDYLPWVAASENVNVFHMNHNTCGIIWRCNALAFADEKVITTLSGLFRLDLPEGSVLQFILHADEHIEETVRAYVGTKTRGGESMRISSERYADFFRYGAKNGVKKLDNIPFRNFCLYVALQCPEDDIEAHKLLEIKKTIADILKGAYLCPREMEAPHLLDWMRRLFNESPSPNNQAWDYFMPLRKQVIFAETDIKKSWNKLRIGKKVFKCITPKYYPQFDFKDEDWTRAVTLQTNRLFGGIEGMTTDIDQIRTPFLYSLNIVFSSKKTNALVERKCVLIRKQKRIGSYYMQVKEKQDEYSWATDEIKRGTKFLRVLPMLWLYDTCPVVEGSNGGSETVLDEKKLDESVTTAIRLWENEGFIMQRDVGILPALFISSLPFGLKNIGTNLDMLDRDFIRSPIEIAPALPIQADFAGFGKPVQIFVGRKGQTVPVDMLFSDNAGNRNGLIAGGSGKGKSVKCNYLVDEFFASGAIIRITDIGNSYKMNVLEKNGRFMSFSEDSEECLNPFTHLSEEDFKNGLASIAAIISRMAFPNDIMPVGIDNATAQTLIKKAVTWAWKQNGNQAEIDDSCRYLKNYSQVENDSIDSTSAKENILSLANTIAFNLEHFLNHYGRWFRGKSTMDFKSDEIVCLEVERLKNQKDLFDVVMMQIINEFSMDLYLSEDRSKKRVLIFDELKQYINDSAAIAEIVASLYDRARKYGGSVWTILQSLLFLEDFGSVGKSMWANSDFKFFLESEDHQKVSKGVADLSPFELYIVKSVKSKLPDYSEFVVKTPVSFGVARLVLPRLSYYKYTSQPDEIAKIEALVQKGMSFEEARHEMLRLYG